MCKDTKFFAHYLQITEIFSISYKLLSCQVRLKWDKQNLQ